LRKSVFDVDPSLNAERLPIDERPQVLQRISICACFQMSSTFPHLGDKQISMGVASGTDAGRKPGFQGGFKKSWPPTGVGDDLSN